MERSTRAVDEPGSGLEQFQAALLRVPGVSDARVVGPGTAATEIHIVTDSDRSPKQIVRDVQSLAAATFGMRIDHRIVSVVRLEGTPQPAGTINRPFVEKIGVGSRNNLQWVEVTLRWPDGRATNGSGASGISRQATARGAAVAVVECLDHVVRAKGVNIEIDLIELHRMGGAEWVLAQATIYEGGSASPLLGSAPVRDDAASAAAKAVLDAVNRKLFR